jgi:Beta-eliminating lyase
MTFAAASSATEVPAELRETCTRFLARHGPVVPARLLADIPVDTVPDQYGEGGVVALLETEIAGLLGKPAALYLPSGIMAQQSVLRVHADRRQRRAVVYHPMCHLERHEGQALQRLHGLAGRPAGEAGRLLTLADLTVIAEAPAALLIELPQRDLGGQQPAWEDLEAQVSWARDRGGLPAGPGAGDLDLPAGGGHGRPGCGAAGASRRGRHVRAGGGSGRGHRGRARDLGGPDLTSVFDVRGCGFG